MVQIISISKSNVIAFKRHTPPPSLFLSFWSVRNTSIRISSSVNVLWFSHDSLMPTTAAFVLCIIVRSSSILLGKDQMFKWRKWRPFPFKHWKKNNCISRRSWMGWTSPHSSMNTSNDYYGRSSSQLSTTYSIEPKAPVGRVSVLLGG